MNIMTNNVQYKNLLLVVFSIVVIGSFLLYSASSSFAFYKFNKPDSYFFVKHLVWFFIGTIALFLISNINYEFLRDKSKKILFISWFVILIPIFQKIFLDGDNVARWLKIGNFSLMTTSDLGKISLIIFTCAFIDKNYSKINNIRFMIKNYLPYLLITLLLIFYQPDLSTTIVLSLIIFSLLYIAGISKKIISYLMISGLLSVIVILSSINNYQQLRFLNWLKSFSGSGNLDQSYFSILALANGGFFGKGIGDSIFKYNGFIPEGQTDFILAIIGEEIGFIGIFIIFGMFSILFWQGLIIAKNCNDRFSMLLSFGIVINIFFYLIINASYVIGILPTTGLPIPFVSYGGSQTIFTLASIGILLNISKTNNFYQTKRKYYV
tara:strand:- start:437 stop:1576 length:1140 start_codon:yes stop_codon:yes gene_type:complete